MFGADQEKMVEMLECKYITFISRFCLKYFYNDSFLLILAQFWNHCLFSIAFTQPSTS